MSTRLEALKLAVQTYSKYINIDEENILACAQKYVKFIEDTVGGNSSVNPQKLHLDSTSRKK